MTGFGSFIFDNGKSEIGRPGPPKGALGGCCPYKGEGTPTDGDMQKTTARYIHCF